MLPTYIESLLNILCLRQLNSLLSKQRSLRVLIITTETKRGNAGQSAGMRSHPTNSNELWVLFWMLATLFYLVLSRERLVLMVNITTLYPLTFLLMFRTEKKKQAKLEGFLSLSCSHWVVMMMVMILREHLIRNRHSYALCVLFYLIFTDLSSLSLFCRWGNRSQREGAACPQVYSQDLPLTGVQRLGF